MTPQKTKREQLDAYAVAKFAAGAPVAGGLHIGLDASSRADLAGMGATAVAIIGGAAIPWPTGFQDGWISVENQRYPMPTPADGIALAIQVSPYYSLLVQRYRDLKDAIAAAADQAALDAVDITAGWPS